MVRSFEEWGRSSIDEQDLGPAPMDQPGWFVMRLLQSWNTRIDLPPLLLFM